MPVLLARIPVQEYFFFSKIRPVPRMSVFFPLRCAILLLSLPLVPMVGTADTEIKAPSVENHPKLPAKVLCVGESA